MFNLKLNRKTLQGQVNQHNEFMGKYQLNKEEIHYLTKGNMEDLRFYTIMERMLVVQNDCILVLNMEYGNIIYYCLEWNYWFQNTNGFFIRRK